MKFFVKFIIFLLLLTHCLKIYSEEIHRAKFNVNANIAGLYPQSRTFRKIYGIAPLYRLESLFLLSSHIDCWINLSYFYNKGHSIPLKYKTTIHLIPLSLGLNYMNLIFYDLHFHLGAGPCYTWMRINNKSSFVKKIRTSGLGGVFKLGIDYQYKKFLFLFFLDYYLQYFHFSDENFEVKRHSRYVGGLLFGVGVGRNF
jgi:hypothetical protein